MTAPAAFDRKLAIRLALVWLVLALIALAVAAERIAGLNLRGDDALRLVQVRDLLAGQGWFDLTQYRIAPPKGVTMHWSRLVDAPLALVIAALSPLVGAAAAEPVALVIVPLATLAVVVAAVGFVSARLFDHRTAGFSALTIGLLGPVLFQLQPLRIDHHGWQIAAVAVALTALVARDPRKAGAIAGLALAFGMTISLEVLPVAALFAGIFALGWLRAPAAPSRLPAFLSALAGGLCVFFLVTLGPSAFATYCDAVGPAHLLFFATVALGSVATARFARSVVPIVLGLGLSGIVGLGLFGWVAPQCLGTPFGSLDPLVHDYWYANVGEGRPIWIQDPALAVPAAIQLALGLAASVALWLGATRSKGKRRFWLDYTLLLAGLTVTALLVWRSMAFAGVVAAIPLGWLVVTALARIEALRNPLAKIGALAGLALGLMPSLAFNAAAAIASTPDPATAEPDAPPSVSIVESDCRDPALLARFAALPQGVVFTHFDIGPAILMNTPHAVVATGHHRAEAAMRDTIAGFLARPDAARSIVKERGADYLAFCSDIGETDLFAGANADGLANALSGGNPPTWLDPVTGFEDSTLAVYRVR